MSGPKLIIGIDPGGASGTGIAWWEASQPDVVSTEQIANCQNDGPLQELIRLLNDLAGSVQPLRLDVVHIVCERFEFRLDETERTKIDYTPAEVIGAIRLWALGRSSVKLMLSGASLGKGFWTDDKIKTLALWVPGKRHAMDALRHLLRYRLFTLRHQYLLEKFRPVDE